MFFKQKDILKQHQHFFLNMIILSFCNFSWRLIRIIIRIIIRTGVAEKSSGLLLNLDHNLDQGG